MTIKTYKYIVSAILLASIVMPLTAGAYYVPAMPHLYLPGVDQVSPAPTPLPYATPKPVHLNFDIFGGSSSNDATQNITPAKDANGNQITLVSADNVNTYAIIGGKKHLIPQVPDILAEYNYKVAIVQNITPAQLAKYPRADLLMLMGDTKHIFYLTEGGMIRLMPSDKVIESYGDRKEDAIVISKVEFNFYPVNKYIYLGNPLNRDVFQIVGATEKRYLTPMAVQRLGITQEAVAPVNQTEYDAYKIGSPIIQ